MPEDRTGAPQTISADKRVDIWLEHTNKLWRAVYATPLMAVAIIGGWYSLWVAQQSILAGLVLGLGIVSMGVQFAIINRMSQYDAAFFAPLRERLPEVPRPLLGLAGRHLALSVPVVLVLMQCLLLVLTVMGSPSEPKGV